MLITRAYTLDTGATEAESESDEIQFDNSNEPVVAAVNQILFNAAEANASDFTVTLRHSSGQEIRQGMKKN